jgi:hypothetical protein
LAWFRISQYKSSNLPWGEVFFYTLKFFTDKAIGYNEFKTEKVSNNVLNNLISEVFPL